MIDVIFPAGYDEITAPKLTQWDHGQKLRIYGLSLPRVIQVHFCDKTCETAYVRIAYKQEDGHSEVDVPNILLQNKYDIHAFIYFTDYEEAIGVTSETVGNFYVKGVSSSSEGDTYTKVTLPQDYVEGTTYYKSIGKTTKAITIPVNERTKPEDFIGQPDPSEQDIIDELLEYCQYLGAKVDEYRIFSDVRIMTKAEYQALTEKEEGVIYAFSDDSTLEDINAEITKIKDGTTEVKKATNATNAINATNATNATNAKKAEETSFTNSQWVYGYTFDVGYLDEKTLPKSGYYHIQINMDEYSSDYGPFLDLGVIYWESGNTTMLPNGTFIDGFGKITYYEKNDDGTNGICRRELRYRYVK